MCVKVASVASDSCFYPVAYTVRGILPNSSAVDYLRRLLHGLQHSHCTSQRCGHSLGWSISRTDDVGASFSGSACHWTSVCVTLPGTPGDPAVRPFAQIRRLRPRVGAVDGLSQARGLPSGPEGVLSAWPSPVPAFSSSLAPHESRSGGPGSTEGPGHWEPPAGAGGTPFAPQWPCTASLKTAPSLSCQRAQLMSGVGRI